MTPFPTLTLAPITIRPGDPTLTPSLTPLPSQTPTLPPEAVQCSYPAGWQPYTVQAGDTIGALAQKYGVSIEALTQGNCLISASLLPNMVLWVPYLPPSPSPIPCGRPPGWIVYIVQPGDTLFSLGLAYNVSVSELMIGNCLPDSRIRSGQRLFVPNIATRTPQASPTSTPSPTPLPTTTPTASATTTPG